jgi:uncharacterized membrane protein
MKTQLSLGQFLADKIAYGMGSWSFLIIQTLILFFWIIFNIISLSNFDPYPFVFLNLVLSFQAAYAAPIIIMSSNRQEEIDRDRSIKIYNLEKQQHENLVKLIDHIDNHFHDLNKKIIDIESKIN